MRKRCPSSASLTAIRPPSPRAKRFFVGKKLKVEAMLVAIPPAPNACAASSITGRPKPLRSGAGRPKRCTGMIVLVWPESLRSTSAGSRFSVAGSMSAKTGVAPRRAIASAVALNVNAGQITSSPGPTPSASSTRTSASVPLAQLTVSCVPSSSAASRSKASTSGPKMNRPVSSVRANASCSFGISGAYCALTSTWGIDMAGSHRSRAAPAQCPQGDRREDREHDGDLDEAEVVVQRVPVPPERPAGAREHEAPDRVADQREHVVAGKRALENTGRDRHEGAGHGRDTTDEHGPRVPALEPSLGALELLRRQVEPPATALEERTAAALADPPADVGADLVADDAREHDREVRG